jgi:hypothetical protein
MSDDALSPREMSREELMKCLEEAESQLAAIDGEEDYASAALYAESKEDAEYWSECDRRQAEARASVEQEIASLKQRLAKLSEASETAKE